MAAMNNLFLPSYFFLLALLHLIQPASAVTCRFYCGNITVGFPFSLQTGCGHPSFRDLLFCVNGVLMLHIPSGSYRPKGNGFVVEPWRAPYLTPPADNVFLLLGCQAESPLFEGFPQRHLPCRNVSGMGCEEYYACPAWEGLRPRSGSSAYGSTSPPECCSVAFGEIQAINLTHLGCQGYSSAYNTAPVRSPGGPGAWSYGIRASYSVPADHNAFCQSCEATSGACGYATETDGNLCVCDGRNSTSNCDSVGAEAEDERIDLLLAELKGKDITELIASGREKFAYVPSGGGGVAVVVSAGGGGGAATVATAAAVEPKKEEKVEEYVQVITTVTA